MGALAVFNVTLDTADAAESNACGPEVSCGLCPEDFIKKIES